MAKKKQRRDTPSANPQRRAPEHASDDVQHRPEPMQAQDDTGQPGGGRGRRDAVGRSGIYPASGGEAPADAEVRDMASWGQGARGAEGYADAGGSELIPHDGQLLGGLDVGPSGAPMPDRPPDDPEHHAREPRSRPPEREPDQ